MSAVHEASLSAGDTYSVRWSWPLGGLTYRVQVSGYIDGSGRPPTLRVDFGTAERGDALTGSDDAWRVLRTAVTAARTVYDTHGGAFTRLMVGSADARRERLYRRMIRRLFPRAEPGETRRGVFHASLPHSVDEHVLRGLIREEIRRTFRSEGDTITVHISRPDVPMLADEPVYQVQFRDAEHAVDHDRGKGDAFSAIRGVLRQITDLARERPDTQAFYFRGVTDKRAHVFPRMVRRIIGGGWEVVDGTHFTWIKRPGYTIPGQGFTL